MSPQNQPASLPSPTLSEPAATAPVIAPTPEELKANAVDTAIAMGWEDPPPKPAEPEPEPAAPAEPAEPAAPTPPAHPAPAPEPAITMDDTPPVVRRPRAPQFRVSEPGFELSPEDQRDYPVICFMAHKNASKYGTLPGQFLEFAKKHYEYVKKWEAEHEGDEYDAEAKEHAAFYAGQPVIDPSEIDEFRIKLEVAKEMQPVIEEREKEEDAKIEQTNFERMLPKIVQNVSRQVVTMVDEVDPELGKLLRDDKGGYRIDPAAEAAVEAADPIAYPILKEIQMKELVPLIGELEKLAIPGTKYRLDPNAPGAQGPLHERIARYQMETEQAILELPEADRGMPEGRKFSTHADLLKKKNAVMRSNATAADKEAEIEKLDREFYTLTVDDLQEIIRDDLVAKGKRLIAQANAAAERKYGKRVPNEPPTPPTNGQPAAVAAPPEPASAPSAPPVNPNPRPRPPSLSSGADVVPNPTGVGAGVKKFSEVASDVMFK